MGKPIVITALEKTIKKNFRFFKIWKSEHYQVYLII